MVIFLPEFFGVVAIGVLRVGISVGMVGGGWWVGGHGKPMPVREEERGLSGHGSPCPDLECDG
jgi:hypothetical protein